MKKSPLRKTSRKRAKEMAQYRVLKKKFLKEAQFCEFPDCTHLSQDLHHANGRNGKRLLDRRNFVALCRQHHRWLHDNPKRARELGMLK